MDGDSEVPARDGVAVSMSVFVYTTVDEPTEWAVYQVEWTLQAEDAGTWTAVTLSDGTTTQLSPTTTVVLTYEEDETPNFETVEITDSLVPLAKLDPQTNYRVLGQLKRLPFLGSWADVDSQKNSAAQQLYHYSNSASDDSARNVIAELDSISITNPFLLDGATDSAKRGFTVETGATIRRWDGYDAALTLLNIEVRYEVELIDGSGVSIELEDASFTRPEWTWSYDNSGADPAPSETTASESFTIVPAVQLDPTATYTARITITHVEETSPTEVVESGNQLATAATQLLHFNGTLAFASNSTTLTDFTRSPQPATVNGAGYVSMTLNDVAGHLNQGTEYSFSAPAGVNLELYPDGTAAVKGLGANITVTQPADDIGSSAAVRFLRKNMLLSTSGLSADITTYLPQGMSYRESGTAKRLHSGQLALGTTALTDSLRPSSSVLSYSPANPISVSEETKPLQLGATSIEWAVTSGQFQVKGAGAGEYVRAQEAAYLLGAAVPLEEKVKPDNTGYYQAFKTVLSTANEFFIYTDANAAAILDLECDLNPGSFITHFPLGTEISFGSGSQQITGDVVTAGGLLNVQKLSLDYERACVDRDGSEMDGCSSNSDTGAFTVDVGSLSFTPDGGLVGSGALEANAFADKELRWGTIDGTANYAHTLSSFSDGTFHMTGHFLPGMGGSATDFNPDAASRTYSDAGPARTLLAATKGGSMARPGSVEDAAGSHDYAGVNLSVGSDNTVTDTAYIAGLAVPYFVRGCNHFYVRPSGVTGTLEGDPDSFPSTLTLYGYDFKFDYYGLAFVQNSTSPERSFTAGSVVTPFPADATFEFDGLSFTCPGGLAEARLPDGGLDKQLRYWSADFDVSTLSFTSTDGCDPSAAAYLTLGATVYSTLLDSPLHGIAGIDPDGELISKDFSDTKGLETTVTSRFRMPNRIQLNGPDEELYDLVAISEGYFNDYGSTAEQTAGDGRLNFAATADVPFFEDLEVQVRTTASQNTNPDASVQLMGGWLDGVDSFFTSTFFDDSNRAWPDAGISEALYRNESGAAGDPSAYLIHARQNWLGVVEFDYPLKWSSSLRSFTAQEPNAPQDLVVVEVSHQLDYLSAENAELSFGVVYQGLPEVNLTNFAFNQLDESSGALEAMVQAFRQDIAGKGEAAVGALEDGVNGINAMLQDQIDAMLEEFYTTTIDPIVDALYNGLDQLDHQTAAANDWITQVEDETQRLIVNYSSAAYDPAGSLTSVRDAIKTLDSTAADAASLINEVDAALEQVQLALRVISDQVYIAADSSVTLEVPAVPDSSNTIQGLLYQDEGDFQIVSSLISALIAELSAEIGGELAGMLGDVLEAPVGELNTLINEQLEAVRPTLEKVQEILAETDSTIADVRSEIAATGDLVQEIEAILDAADGLIDAASVELQVTIKALVLERIPEPSQFVEYSEAEVKALIRQEIEDRIRELEIIPEFQLVLRQHFYDLDLQIKEGIDTAFAQVNEAIKGLLKEFLSDFDDTINGFLGDLGSSLGAGEVTGFAHINEDALRLLRLDAHLQLQVPEDFEFNGYLQIKQLSSDGSDACSYGGSDTAKEVTMGALGVPVAWVSDGMSVDVEGKVVFTTYPVGLGGRIEMVDGEFGFESFTITDLGAAMSFGATENYLAAEVGLAFQSYAMYGGVFFGQTCDIAPLEMVNPQAASVLGNPNPTFSGAYVYGEAHIPVSEALLGIPASCMFKITAGVGAGAFYFVEGPTFGGQMLLAVSGEALCLVSIKGDVSLVGVKVADDFRFSGRGRLSGKVGSCPFCVKFGKTLNLEYKNDRWSYDL